MQTNIIPLTGAKTRLLRPYDVMALTGIGSHPFNGH